MNNVDLVYKVKSKIDSSFDSLDCWMNLSETELHHPVKSGWNIIEILEHITLTNHYLLILINKATKKALKMNNASSMIIDLELHFSKVEEIGIHEMFYWHRPDHMDPKGKMLVDEINTILNNQRNQCLEILDKLKNGEGLNYRTTMTVNGLGKLDVYQYLYFLARHIDRHVSQMEMVKFNLES